MSIMTSPYKHPKTGVYYFRMAVPKQLVPLIGKTVFKTSLKTKDLKEAKRVFGSHLEQAHKQIELAKLKLSNSPSVELTDYDCAIIAERWYERTREEIDSTGDYGSFLSYERHFTADGQEHIHKFGLSDTIEFQGLDAAEATNKEYEQLVDVLEGYIISQLDLEGLVVPKADRVFRKLVGAFYTYVRHIERICEARHKRDFGYSPITKTIGSKPLSGSAYSKRQGQKRPKNSISSILIRYIESASVNRKAPQSLDEVSLQIERLIEVIGDIDVTEVNRGHISKYRDTLLQLPKSKKADIRSRPIKEQIELARANKLPCIAPATVKTIMRKTSPVFGYAFDLGLIDANPYKGVAYPKVQDKSEVAEDKGYTAEELSLLFELETFSDVAAQRPYGLACYWVPLLCRFTGSRIEEMVQLRKDDIKISNEGIYFIYIREGEDQHLKASSAVRLVPIHDQLVELGFLDFVNSSGEFLFSELKPNKHGKRSPYLVKWWSKQVKQTGVKTKSPSHSFRHSLRTTLRDLGVVDSVADSITGHAPANIGALYGTVKIDTKKGAMDNVPRLELSRIW